jgi:hypothetical protein
VSSLIFYTDENQALIATDTLATSATEPGTPFKFTTKAFIIPHLRMIIAGTGCGGFCDKWFLQINDKMIVKGIVNLDHHTPRNLTLLWSSHKEEFSIPDDVTTTVFHFGFSEEDQKICSYMYSTAYDFEPKMITYGLSGKPEFNCPEPYELPKDFKTIMESQRKLQLSETKKNRVYIGGEIQVIHLTKDGFSSYPLCKFDDYDSDESAIYSNYGKV